MAAPPEGEEVHVVVYADSSLSAVCAVAYAVWPLPEGRSESFDSAIIMANRRLSPKAGTSTLRAELSSLRPARRLGYVVVDEAIYAPASLSIIGDSECAIAITRMTAAALKTYCANQGALAPVHSSRGPGHRSSGGLDRIHRGLPTLIRGYGTPLSVFEPQVDTHQWAWQRQEMGMQPSFKSPSLPSFTFCGVDLMGPFLVFKEKNRAS